jgi:hypothetical protein
LGPAPWLAAINGRVPVRGASANAAPERIRRVAAFAKQLLSEDEPDCSTFTMLQRGWGHEKTTLFEAGGLVDITSVAQQSNLIRCVRGGPTTSPAERFQVGPTTARDVRTGLVWQRDAAAAPMTLDSATSTCATLALTGVSPVAAPNIRELRSPPPGSATPRIPKFWPAA